jgi:putative acetyltransferase
MGERSESMGGSPNASEASLVGGETPTVVSESDTNGANVGVPADTHSVGALERPRMQVRPATSADALAVFALHVASIRALGPEGYEPEQVRAWARKDHGPEGYPIEDDAHHFVVAEREVNPSGGASPPGTHNREVVGFGDLVPDAEDADAGGEVRAVYVHPEHAGRGVGSALLAELEGYARGAGVGSLELSASINAVGFYERSGYERVREDTYDTGGAELDVVVFRKRL